MKLSLIQSIQQMVNRILRRIFGTKREEEARG
jgi:hypothetical protein